MHKELNSHFPMLMSCRI